MQKTCMIFAHTSVRTPHWPVLSREDARRWGTIAQYLKDHQRTGEPLTLLYAAAQSSNESIAHLVPHPRPDEWNVVKCPGLGTDDDPGSLEGAVACLNKAWEETSTVVVVTNETLAAQLTSYVADLFRHRLITPPTPHCGTGWILRESRWARFP